MASLGSREPRIGRFPCGRRRWRVLAQVREREDSVKPKISFEVGDKVKVADGPFQNQNGVVEEIDPERGKLRVSVTIFGRETPVDLEYWQVERA